MAALFNFLILILRCQVLSIPGVFQPQRKCIYKYTERWCTTEINKAVETTASYTNTFSVAIWWFMCKFNAALHLIEQLSQE